MSKLSLKYLELVMKKSSEDWFKDLYNACASIGFMSGLNKEERELMESNL